jgi:hypothetical protein
MTACPGWAIYTGMMRLQLSAALDELINDDGDARSALQRQMKCRTLLARLKFEEELEGIVNRLKAEDGEKPIALSRMATAR